MLYNLPNGKTIEITVNQFLEMTDEDLEYLIAFNHGNEINNPFFGSVLENEDKIDDPTFIPDLPDEIIPEEFIPDDI